MTIKPLSIAISTIVHNNKTLLIKRERNEYIGLWGLPGGKVENDEFVKDAAIRELDEEAGIKSEFVSSLGVVSELFIEGDLIKNFNLNVIELKTNDPTIKCATEGEPKWFDLNEIDNYKDEIVPSDYLIIKKMIISKEKNYFESIVEKIGEDHILKKFE